MNQDDFEKYFSEFSVSAKGIDFSYQNEPWNDIGINSLDIILTELFPLYSEMNSMQKEKIHSFFKKETDRLWSLIIFIRRISRLIRSKEDDRWVKTGLIAAKVADNNFDYRDLIVSLVILKDAAEKAGINTTSLIDAENSDLNAYLSAIFQNVRNHSQKDIDIIIKEFSWHSNLHPPMRNRRLR